MGTAYFIIFVELCNPKQLEEIYFYIMIVTLDTRRIGRNVEFSIEPAPLKGRYSGIVGRSRNGCQFLYRKALTSEEKCPEI